MEDPSAAEKMRHEDRRALLIAQYAAVRAEILQLMQSNDRRSFEGVSVSGTLAGILVAATSYKIAVPGVAFLLPAVYLLMSLSAHYKYSARVAVMGSFLSALVDSLGRCPVNWERDIGAFARDVGANLSSKVSITFIYATIGLIAITAGAHSAANRLAQEPSIPALFDAVVTVAASLTMAVSFHRIVSGGKAFAAMRQEYDGYWAGVIHGTPADAP